MAQSITERSVKLFRRHRDEIATRCDLWFAQTRALLADAFRTDLAYDKRRDLAVLEDRVLLSATPIVEAVELTVTQTADVVNGDTNAVADLLKNDGGDGISLREAVLAANEESGPVTIILGPATYLLEIDGNDNHSRMGDLDLTAEINIRGAGAGVTVIDASGIMGADRVIHARNGAAVSIEGVTITGGRGKEGAGILVEEETSLVLRDVIVTGNHSSGRDGGGIMNDEGMLELTDVTIADNSAYNKEGGGIHNSGVAILNRVTLSGNHAKDGGGIYSEGSDSRLSLTNVTISGNHASDKGGGLYAKEQVEILHSTIAFNNAETGGGIEEAGATVWLKNSILSQNYQLDGTTGANVEGTVVSLGHNIDSDGTARLSAIGDQSNVDPLLSRELSFHGGKTRTHALMPGSVAMDVTGLTGAPAVDQRNVSRDANPDVGAFEFIPENNAPPTDISLSDSVLVGNTAGAVVGSLASIDPTTSDSHTYTVDDVRFEVAGDELRLKADEAIEYSSEPTVALQIQSTDSAGNAISKEFVLTVLSPPAVHDSQVFQVVEFSDEGTAIGAIQATDPDSDPSSFEWAIVAGNESGLFVLDAATGELTVADSSQFDYTAASNHVLMVTVSDGTATATAEAVTVEVLNAPPTDIALSDSILTGNTGGAVVGSLASIDPTTSDSHTYTVDDVRFEVVSDELRLKADESIEYANESTITLRIQSTDSAGNRFIKSFDLTVAESSPATNTNALHLFFFDDTEVDLGELNAAQAQGGNASSHDTTGDTDFEADESASEETNHQSADAESRSDEVSDLVASVEAAAMQVAQLTGNQAQLPNGSDAAIPVDAWEGKESKERSNIEQSEMTFGNGFAVPAAVTDVDRDADDTTREELRSGDRLSQRVGFAQRAVVQPQLWQAIESMNDEVHQSIASTPLKIGATATTTAGLTAGYVVWVLRSGLLMSTAFAHLPMWRFMDPLAILDSKGTNNEDDESLQTIVAEEDSADGEEQYEPISTRASADV